MFIQTENTPNPDTRKFIPGQPVLGDQPPVDFATPSDAEGKSGLAADLFAIEGVERVFFGADFVSVTKAEDKDWTRLNPFIMAAIMDHYTAGLPVMETAGSAGGTPESDIVYEGETAEIVGEIKELIETRVRPAVAQDGGDIVFDRFDADTGTVHLHMRGACAGCPSSTYTLKQGIENMLRAYVPEVTAVEAVL